jgi:hypothetical protein
MRCSLIVTSFLALGFGLGGCETEPSSAAGASLRAARESSEQLDQEPGDIVFGDGKHGRTPPASNGEPKPSFIPEVGDEVLVALQSGSHTVRGEVVVVTIGRRTVELRDGQYRTRSGTTFAIHESRFVADN